VSDIPAGNFFGEQRLKAECWSLKAKRLEDGGMAGYMAATECQRLEYVNWKSD
jgi:hypothetical protein